MKTKFLHSDSRSVDLSLRSISFIYIGLLILLPIAALSVEAFRGGFSTVWENITAPQALYSLRLTITMAVIMVIINVITGTATAWVMVRYDFPFKGFINAMLDLPFAIPTVVTGIMLVALYGPNSFVGHLFGKAGIEIMYNKPGIVMALLYVSFPFVVRAVQPVLLELDTDMEEAARTLGASRLVTFFRIVLPTLLPAILTGAALSFSRALGEFGSVSIVAGNIPFKTQMSSVYIYGELESHNQQGALGVSVLLLGFSFLILISLNVLQLWSRNHEKNN